MSLVPNRAVPGRRAGVLTPQSAARNFRSCDDRSIAYVAGDITLPDVRTAATRLAIVIASALAGCGRSDTGVHVHARLGALEYDELQFRVTVAGGDVIVDPTTNGRYQGPF